MAFAAFTPSGDAPATPVKRRRSWVAIALLAPGIAYLLLFFLTPMLSLVATSLQVPAEGAGIGQYVAGLRFENYWDGIAEYWPHFVRSFVYALIATFLALLISYPLAYFIGVTARPWPLVQRLALILVIAPFFISFLLRTLAWKQILPAEFIGTDGSVIFGLVYNFIPFMTLPIYTSLERLDTRYLEAGSDLYAPPWTVFRKVTLPLSMPGVVSGTLLTFIPLSGDYVNASSEFLGSTNTRMIGNAIEASFLQTNNYPQAAVLSILLMAMVLVIIAVYVRRTGTEDLL